MLDSVMQANGFDPDSTTLTTKERAQYGFLVNLAIRTAWESELWPQLMVVERRQYRPTWEEAVTYRAGYEVYHAGAYWRGVAESNIGNAPSMDSEEWEPANGMIPYIAFDQPWEKRVIDETGIEWARCLFERDPQLHPDAMPLKGLRPYEQSILVDSEEAPLLPYIRFRPLRPRVSFIPWDPAKAYSIGQRCFRENENESYVAIKPSLGATPEADAEAWAPTGVPEMFADYIRMRVRAERAADDEGKYESLAQAGRELDRLAGVYLHIGGDRLGRRVNWRIGR